MQSLVLVEHYVILQVRYSFQGLRHSYFQLQSLSYRLRVIFTNSVYLKTNEGKQTVTVRHGKNRHEIILYLHNGPLTDFKTETTQ